MLLGIVLYNIFKPEANPASESNTKILRNFGVRARPCNLEKNCFLRCNNINENEEGKSIATEIENALRNDVSNM